MNAPATAQGFQNGTAVAPDASMLFDAAEKPMSKPDNVRILDAKGDTLPKMSNPRNQNVVQIPTWVLTTFGIPAILFIIWFATFWQSTTSLLQAQSEKIAKLENNREAEFEKKLNTAIEQAYKSGQLDGFNKGFDAAGGKK